jgi:hypothetical protein
LSGDSLVLALTRTKLEKRLRLVDTKPAVISGRDIAWIVAACPRRFKIAKSRPTAFIDTESNADRVVKRTEPRKAIKVCLRSLSSRRQWPLTEGNQLTSVPIGL